MAQALLLMAAESRLKHRSTAGSHRYWRINITAFGGGPNVLVQGGSGWALTSGGVYSTVSASAASTTASGQNASNAWGSNTTVAWQSNVVTLPQWVSADLGIALPIQQLRYQGPASTFTNRAATAFDIQWSDDNISWTTSNSYAGLTWGNNELKSFST